MPERNAFVTRSITAGIFAVIVLALIWMGETGIIILLSLICILCVREAIRIFKLAHSTAESFLFVILVLLPFVAAVLGHYGMVRWHLLSIPFISLMVFLSILVSLNKSPQTLYRVALGLSATFILVVMPCMCGIFVLSLLQSGATLFFLGLILLTWSSDVFAYLIGSRFGARPLAPAISPKKTWEGTIGGGLCTCIVGICIGLLSDQFAFLMWITIATVVVVFGTTGDLLESVVKRVAQVKDSGNLLPGHGGFWDRFDSLLGILPFIVLIAYFFAQS